MPLTRLGNSDSEELRSDTQERSGRDGEYHTGSQHLLLLPLFVVSTIPLLPETLSATCLVLDLVFDALHAGYSSTLSWKGVERVRRRREEVRLGRRQGGGQPWMVADAHPAHRTSVLQMQIHQGSGLRANIHVLDVKKDTWID